MERDLVADRSFQPALQRDHPEIEVRQLLTERVLGPEPTSGDRSLDTHIRNLRRKLDERKRAGVEIRNIRGAGYVLTRSTRPR
jgi:two-component system, OmpR family, response regulator CpxR